MSGAAKKKPQDTGTNQKKKKRVNKDTRHNNEYAAIWTETHHTSAHYHQKLKVKSWEKRTFPAQKNDT